MTARDEYVWRGFQILLVLTFLYSVLIARSLAVWFSFLLPLLFLYIVWLFLRAM